MKLAQRLKSHAGLLGILLIALLLRAVYPGLIELEHDEGIILQAAIRLARYGEWTWIGNPTSMNDWLFHSPLFTYLTAIPYLFSANAILPRLLYSLCGVVAVGGTFGLVRRYYGQPAAWMAALILAVNPLAIYWSRFTWNPNLAPPFIVYWMLTGLIGYYEGKRWAQIVHWLMLSVVVQADAALVVVLPLSLGLLIYGWRRSTARTQPVESDPPKSASPPELLAHSVGKEVGGIRVIGVIPSPRAYLITTGIACALTVITLIPWVIGIVGVRTDRIHPTEFHDMGLTTTGLSLPDPEIIWHFTALLTSSATYHLGTLQTGEHRAVWWADDWLNVVLRAQTILVLLAGAYLVWRGVRQGERHFPGLFLAGVLFWPLTYLLYEGQRISDFYMMPTLFAAAVIFGIAFGQLWGWKRLTLLVALGMIAAQAWLTISFLDWNRRSELHFSLADLQTMVRGWADAGGEIVVLDEPQEEKPGERRDRLRQFRVMAEQFPLRISTQPHAFPVAPGGQMVISVETGETIPALFGSGDLFETPGYTLRGLVIYPADLPRPNYLPALDHFGDLMRVQGLFAEDSPQAGQSWPVGIVWQPDRSVSDFYQFSVRLIGEDGTTYAQTDGTALEPGLWRKGDTVFSRFNLPVSADLPDGIMLHVDLVLYAWPQMANVPVVDESGGAAGYLMRLEP